MPQRIQLSRRKGWRMPENTRKVDRTTRFGNPFQADKGGDGSRANLVQLFREYVARPEQAAFVADVRANIDVDHRYQADGFPKCGTNAALQVTQTVWHYGAGVIKGVIRGFQRYAPVATARSRLLAA